MRRSQSHSILLCPDRLQNSDRINALTYSERRSSLGAEYMQGWLYLCARFPKYNLPAGSFTPSDVLSQFIYHRSWTLVISANRRFQALL